VVKVSPIALQLRQPAELALLFANMGAEIVIGLPSGS